MIYTFFRKFKKFFHSRAPRIDPDEIFLDSSNLPSHDPHQFEGRIEKPIGSTNIFFIKAVFSLCILVFFYRVVVLQIAKGEAFAERSTNNHLRHEIIFAHRGTIVDRNDIPLAWNEVEEKNFPKRKYVESGGFSNLLGYIKYPKKDSSGNFYSFETSGEDGIEKYYNDVLSGENGVKLTEVDVKGEIESQSTIELPKNGEKLVLSIDKKLQEKMAYYIKSAVLDFEYQGGAGVMMDAKTGEVVAMVTYPEYDSSILTEGEDRETLASFFKSKGDPFLDRPIFGLYSAGSIVKPFIALAAMSEKTIDPYKSILSTGSISIPNPYDPDKPTVFRDWKAHGYVDMREAIAVSSDVYFYAVGGGYKDQKGLGIVKIDEYLKKFLFTVPTESFFAGPPGTIPSPEWKAKNFNGDIWRVGDTYHTTIGQYGFQTTPLQVARAVTGIANQGKVVSPTILKGEQGKVYEIIDVEKENFRPVKEGMVLCITAGTCKALNISGLDIAAKTGTAEIGTGKKYVNSWVTGFLPVDDPKYVFTLVLEKGPISTQAGAIVAMSNVIKWAKENAPEYAGLPAKELGITN